MGYGTSRKSETESHPRPYAVSFTLFAVLLYIRFGVLVSTNEKLASWDMILYLFMAGTNPVKRPAYLRHPVLLTLLFAAAIWLMGQPMEMRGTFLVG